MPKKSGIKLNESQQKAVEHNKGPLLVVAGAGTGKTRVITERIKHLIENEGIKPQEILALTFTEKAATEMVERVEDIMPLGYEEPWIYTFHSFCDRILRNEGLEIGLDTSYKLLSSPEQWLLFRQNIFKFDLKYYRPLGNPTKFISAILKFISRLQDENISPEQLRKFADDFEGAEEEKVRWQELANVFEMYQEIKLNRSRMDFGDLITWTIRLFKERPKILEKYRNQFKHVLVDEFQDTNYSQYELIKLLCPQAEDKRSLITVGDDSQCLPAEALISTPNGDKKISEIKEGDVVFTAVGKGHTSYSKVSKVFKNKKTSVVLTFTTEDGKRVKVTDNHKMFCFLPATGKNSGNHFVYLMHQRNIGWRIGITNCLRSRLRIEHHADEIFVLKSFDTDQEARYYEAYLSAKYGLPTVTFLPRPGQAISSEWITKLFKELKTDEKVKVLAKDFHLDLDSPVYAVDAVTRGVSNRLKINFLMCYRNYRGKNSNNGLIPSPTISHLVHFETSNEKAISDLENAGFKLDKAKKGKRFRFSSSNIQEAWKMAEEISKVTGAFIDKKFNVGKFHYQHLSSRVVPASHIVSGCYLPVLNGNEIVYKKVIKREEEVKTLDTYDLEVEKTHNFIADGVVVHNSIYKFRGAAVSNIIEFMHDYPEAEMVTLNQNYRSSQPILDASYKLIQNNNPDTLESKLGISKQLISEAEVKALKPEIFEADTVEEEVDTVVFKILEIIAKEPQYTYKDIAILARANNHLDPFMLALRKYGLPYQLVGNRGLYDREEIRDILAFLKVLINPQDTISLYRVLNIDTLQVPQEEISRMLASARYRKIDLWDVVRESKVVDVQNFYKTVRSFQDQITKATPVELVYNLVNSINYLQPFISEETVENQLTIKNLDLFLNRIKNFEVEYRSETNEVPNVIHFVDYIELMIEAGENPAQAEVEDVETIKLMTVHASKGLEFPVVFMVNLVSDRFPTRDRSEQIEVPEELIKETLPIGDAHIQEERRLFYVGMTRAQKYLYMTFAKNYGGKRDKNPSGFLPETGLKPMKIDLQELKKGNAQTGLFGQSSGFREPKLQKITNFTPNFLSYTQISTYLDCGLKYKYAYVLQIPTPPNHALSFGSTIHDTLRDFHTKLMFEPNTTLEELYEIYEKNWQPIGYMNEEHRQKYYESGKELLKKYYEQNKTTKKPLAIERSFNLKIDGIRFYGRIDRIDQSDDGSVEIIDYKTGSSKDQKEVDKDAQVAFYAIGVKEALNMEPKKLSLYFVEDGTKVTTTRTPEQLEAKKEEVKETIKKIKAGEFEPRPGMQCKWCDYRGICPFAQKD